MRKSKTLARIANNETVRMCCLGHFVPSFIRLAAHYEYDCVWLDLEHRNISDRDVEALLVHSHLHDIDVMVRTPTREKARLYRYLEDGAAGLMIPHVNTAEQAAGLVNSVKFLPLGDRGLDGAGLDADYFVNGPDGVLQFLEEANNETFLVVQVETPEAIGNVEAIASTPGPGSLKDVVATQRLAWMGNGKSSSSISRPIKSVLVDKPTASGGWWKLRSRPVHRAIKFYLAFLTA